ncbi:MAG: hypothetical protein HY660_12125 [Armatimonadetes bacterium]|nr:hypothetical protein [Armatimonadota bacterium]
MGDHREHQPELSEEDLQLVEELDQIGAATPIQLALRLQAQPDQVRPKLRRLKEEGWLDVQQREGYEKEIYFLSSKARSAIGHRHAAR